MPLHRHQVPPWIISNDAASVNSVLTVTFTANNVFLYAFEVSAPCTITGAKWRMGATVGTGGTQTTDIGIYDANGNLLGHTGATTNVASTNMSQAFLSSVLLTPGLYFMAFVSQNGSDTYLGISGTTSKSTTSRNRLATNLASAGVLPATTGGYSDTPGNVPAISLTISGGLT